MLFLLSKDRGFKPHLQHMFAEQRSASVYYFFPSDDEAVEAILVPVPMDIENEAEGLAQYVNRSRRRRDRLA